MELKERLIKPYTEDERIEFVIEQNHNLGFEIRETDDELQAWGYTDEEIEQMKREKINKLTMTKRVFALALQNMGISYTQLKELIATNEQAQLEWDLCVELERGNPLLDAMAGSLGVTSEQLDTMFKMANGKD
jgi:hypothetical protein